MKSIYRTYETEESYRIVMAWDPPNHDRNQLKFKRFIEVFTHEQLIELDLDESFCNKYLIDIFVLKKSLRPSSKNVRELTKNLSRVTKITHA